MIDSKPEMLVFVQVKEISFLFLAHWKEDILQPVSLRLENLLNHEVCELVEAATKDELRSQYAKEFINILTTLPDYFSALFNLRSKICLASLLQSQDPSVVYLIEGRYHSLPPDCFVFHPLCSESFRLFPHPC